MLNRIPKYTPSLADLLEDIGKPPPKAVAKALGVTERTVRHWLKRGDAPRPVLLALFWITRWGQEAVHCDLFNDARLHAGMAACMKREVDRLHEQLAWLASIADFGSANAPTLSNPVPKPRLALVDPPGEPGQPRGKAKAPARANRG